MLLEDSGSSEESGMKKVWSFHCKAVARGSVKGALAPSIFLGYRKENRRTNGQSIINGTPRFLELATALLPVICIHNIPI
jgi:hypothetical protein